MENYIWENLDKHFTPKEIVSFLRLNNSKPENKEQFINQLKSRNLSHSKLDIIHGSPIVLDLGCGMGDDLFEISTITNPDAQLYGIDKSNMLIKEAITTKATLGINNINFIQGEANHLPFEDNKFDFVCSRRTLQHLKNPLDVLKEAYRVLKPNGKIIIDEPDRGTATLNSVDTQTTKMVLSYTENSIRNPWIGRFLLEYLLETGFKKINLNGFVDLFTDFHSANSNFALKLSAEKLVQKGELTKEIAENWLKDLINKSNHKKLLFSFNHFIAVGVK